MRETKNMEYGIINPDSEFIKQEIDEEALVIKTEETTVDDGNFTESNELLDKNEEQNPLMYSEESNEATGHVESPHSSARLLKKRTFDEMENNSGQTAKENVNSSFSTDDKRKRTTTRPQFALMIRKMKEHPDIAKNVSKNSDDLSIFWESLKSELNAAGPPSKSVWEWKKVWSDYKSAIRKKLLHNKRERSLTGGKGNNLMWLNTMELEVAELAALENPPEVPNVVKVVYLQKKKQVTDNKAADEQMPSSSETVEAAAANYATSVQEDEDENQSNNNSNDDKMLALRLASKKRSLKQMKLLEKQISMQETYYNTMTTSMSTQEKHLEQNNDSFKNIRQSLEKMHIEYKRTNALMQAFLDETNRHNYEMEKIALEQLGIEKQILEIKQKKFNRMVEREREQRLA